MASNKPVLHGRDHLPGGPDPIPILAATLGIQYVYLGAEAITLPDDGTEVAFDFQGGIDSAGADAVTDNPEVFATAVMSGAPFAGVHGLKISAVGVYAAFSSIVTVTPTESSASTPKAQSMGFQKEGTGSFSQSTFNFGGDFDQAVFGHQDLFELWSIGVDTLGAFTSVTVGLSVQNNRGGGTGDVDVKGYLTVVRLGHADISDVGTTSLF